MKQANIPAVSRFVDTKEVDAYFDNEGHRTAVSQRALQVHTDPMLGHATLDGVGFIVSEILPYEVDLDWSDLTEPEEIADVVDLLGRATAKIHCASDEDSEQDLVDFQVEEAIASGVERRRKEFTAWIQDFGIDYAERVRKDHALFVGAFREGRIGVSATDPPRFLRSYSVSCPHRCETHETPESRGQRTSPHQQQREVVREGFVPVEGPRGVDQRPGHVVERRVRCPARTSPPARLRTSQGRGGPRRARR